MRHPSVSRPRNGGSGSREFFGVVAMASSAGLIADVLGLARDTSAPEAAFLGVVILAHVAFLVGNARQLTGCRWSKAVATFATAGLLWTTALRNRDRWPWWAEVAIILLVPPASALAFRLIGEADPVPGGSPEASTVRGLIARGRAFGARPRSAGMAPAGTED